jgi:hypothetical protein
MERCVHVGAEERGVNSAGIVCVHRSGLAGFAGLGEVRGAVMPWTDKQSLHFRPEVFNLGPLRCAKHKLNRGLLWSDVRAIYTSVDQPARHAVRVSIRSLDALGGFTQCENNDGEG